MINTVILGASGYTGVELVAFVHNHPKLSLDGIFVSANSVDTGKPFSALHAKWQGVIDTPVEALTEQAIEAIAEKAELVLMALPHEASHNLAEKFLKGSSGENGATVMDLSGAFRLSDLEVFANAYGFEHGYPELNSDAVYGLAEWNADQIKQSKLVAVPGCYPTASLSALKPLHENNLLDNSVLPVINATSGVSGAGRKASLVNSFCEVSLNAYGVLGHRHQPEIAEHLGTNVIFTPHLGNFKRGILATITVKLAEGTTQEQVDEAYTQAYQNSKIVRLAKSWPTVQQVENTPHCDLCWKFDPETNYLVVCSAIDNLLKGAASQAIQCVNIHYGFEDHLGLLPGASL